MKAGLACPEALALVKSARSDIIDRGAQPDAFGHSSLSEFEKRQPDTPALCWRGNEQLVQASNIRLQGEEPEPTTGLIARQMHRPSEGQLPRDSLLVASFRCEPGDRETRRPPAFEPKTRHGRQVPILIGADDHTNVPVRQPGGSGGGAGYGCGRALREGKGVGE